MGLFKENKRMILSSSFNTCINELLERVDNNTFFISDWNKDDGILDFNIDKFYLTNDYHKQKNTYFFSDEFKQIKDEYPPLLTNSKEHISSECFSIVSNCTIANFLCLYYVKTKKEKLNALILAPTYFSYIRILQDVGANINYIDCYASQDIPEQICEVIYSYQINIIIATEPLFGTGVSLSENILKRISSICEEQDIFFIIDYTYGGMKWHENNCEQDSIFLSLINNKHTLLVESICKRIFLNGIKHGIIFADSEIIKAIEDISVYTAGCLSEQQILLYKNLYAIENRKYIIKTINENNMYYESNYSLIKTFLANTSFDISLCDCGYFCVLGIPKITQRKNMDIAKEILHRTNILTIPHDRYIFDMNKFYYFRVNLSLEQNKLIQAIKLLSQTYFNGIN